MLPATGPPPRASFNPAAGTFPGFSDTPTPLVRVPHLAAALGVREAWVKDEASRLGLPACCAPWKRANRPRSRGRTRRSWRG